MATAGNGGGAWYHVTLVCETSGCDASVECQAQLRSLANGMTMISTLRGSEKVKGWTAHPCKCPEHAEVPR